MFGELLTALNPATLLANAATNLGSNYINARLAGETRDRNEANAWDMYQTQRADENNAVQRRAKDMQAAGINPLLAAGDGAGTASGTTPTGTAPEIKEFDVMGTMNALSNINLTQAQADKINTENNILKPQEAIAKQTVKGLEETEKLAKSPGNPEGFKPITSGPIKKNLWKQIGQGEEYTRNKWFGGPKPQQKMQPSELLNEYSPLKPRKQQLPTYR